MTVLEDRTIQRAIDRSAGGPIRRSSRHRAARLFVSLLLTLGIVSGGALALSGRAYAADAAGVVAIHNGSWGYQEIVYGKATTRRIAQSSVLDVGVIVTGITGWLVPVAVTLYLVKFRAQDALNTGQCFALVRLPGSPMYWPGKEAWGCR